MRYFNHATVLIAVLGIFVAGGTVAQVPAQHVKDLSLLVSPEVPCVWPTGMMPFSTFSTRTFGPGGQHREMIIIDEHTGTQWDAPAHFTPPPESGLPGFGPMGLITGDRVPAWQFCGEACVLDVTEHCDAAPPGSSFLIQPEHVKAWEQKHRPLKFGDVLLFRSDYSDRYYQPFPDGERFVATALRKDTPAWPAPAPETMTYLGNKGVLTLGLDSPSMGPLPDLAAATHLAGSKLGMIWMECGTNLGALPTTGAFYALLGAKHAGGSGSECRCLAITEPKLAARLIASARAKRVADLAVTLHEDFPVTWPGHRPGDEASRYVAKPLNAFSRARGPFFALTHMLDSQVGTHVILPSASLPPEGFDRSRFSADVQAALKTYETQFGPLGHSALTIDHVPLEQLMGEAHVIDVRTLVGSTKASEWPQSPVISLDFVKQHEAEERPIKAGEVVIFFSGHSDAHFQPLPPTPELDPLFAAPLQGQAEGWPSPNPEVLAYLAEKGVKCVATDGPTLGGVEREHALLVNWLAASRGLLVVEFLTHVSEIAGKEAFFIFAPIKIRGNRSGYGRAIALY